MMERMESTHLKHTHTHMLKYIFISNLREKKKEREKRVLLSDGNIWYGVFSCVLLLSEALDEQDMHLIIHFTQEHTQPEAAIVHFSPKATKQSKLTE